MTIHGGPTFTDWQHSKLPPSLTRSVRNTYGDLAYWLAPALEALAEAVAGAFETLAPFIGQLQEAGLLDLEEVPAR